jgi:hypothetical protein
MSEDEGDAGNSGSGFLQMKKNKGKGNPDQIIAIAAKEERKNMVAGEMAKMKELEPRIYTDRIAMVSLCILTTR